VRNAGAVIPAASIKAIFEPMVQLNVDRARPSASIGLGLFIAREITHAHGGAIDVSSSEDAGTVFSVRLPRSLSAQELGRIQRSAD
jgi:signal transduction histidine kinase